MYLYGQVFHPTDEGWFLPFKFLPRILPDEISKPPANTSETIKTICKTGHWFERMGYSERDQNIQKCCGFWLMKEGWDTTPLKSGDTFEDWLQSVSHLQAARKMFKVMGKLAYMQPAA